MAVIKGNKNDNVLFGTGESDFLGGYGGNDTLYGRFGDDVLDGGIGADTMIGRDGNDTYYVDEAGDTVNEFFGEGLADLVKATISYRLYSDVENLILSGSSAIAGFGNELDNRILGNEAANRLAGGGGNDRLEGSLGNDIYVVDDDSDVIVERAGEGTDRIVSRVDYDLATPNVEILKLIGDAVRAGGSEGDDILIGNALDNVLDGRGGADTMLGGIGDDRYFIDAGADRAFEAAGEGDDTVVATVNYNLSRNVEKLVLTGAAARGFGNDGANFIDARDTARHLVDGGGGDDILRVEGDDRAFGGAGDDLLVLTASAGGAQLDGGAGDDILEIDAASLAGISTAGGAGTDMLRFLAPTVTFTGDFSASDFEQISAGTLRGTSANNRLDFSGTTQGIKLDGGGGQDHLIGTSGDDILSSKEGAYDGFGDILNGGAGADQLRGSAGNDRFYVDNAGDVIFSGGGRDVVVSSISVTLGGGLRRLVLVGDDAIDGTGTSSNDVINGNDADNVLRGLDSADRIVGAGGDDSIFGGLSQDAMNGGAGADRFYFDSILPANPDIIEDFTSSDDSIYLDGRLFDALPPGPLDPAVFHEGSAAADADDRIIFDPDTGTLYYDRDGTGTAAQQSFATVTRGIEMSASDFVVY